jgi:hypothetical protein
MVIVAAQLHSDRTLATMFACWNSGKTRNIQTSAKSYFSF